MLREKKKSLMAAVHMASGGSAGAVREGTMAPAAREGAATAARARFDLERKVCVYPT